MANTPPAVGPVAETSSGGARRMDTTMYEITRTKTTSSTAAAQLCLHCGFHPASPRISGFCSWDCYEADDDDEGDEGDGWRAA
jgi:hypothetical protein